MAYKSKCTCVNRRKGMHPRNFWYPHEEHCYYYAKLKEEADDRANRETIQRLYSHYRRQNRPRGEYV